MFPTVLPMLEYEKPAGTHSTPTPMEASRGFHTTAVLNKTTSRRAMDTLEFCLFTTLLMLVKSGLSCDQTEFLQPNGTCVMCPVCGPGEQLSEDCGFGDGGQGVCIPCEKGKFSGETGVAPCRRCTQCNLLSRLGRAACSPTRDAQCGHCLPGYYELRSMTGEVDMACVPCSRRATIHKECLHLMSPGPVGESLSGQHSDSVTHAVTVQRGIHKETKEKRKTFSVLLIGLATLSSVFLTVLLLWALLLTTERFKQIQEGCTDTEGRLLADDFQLSSHVRRAPEPSKTPDDLLQDPLRGNESQVHLTPIVINVTTNIKPPGEKGESFTEEVQKSSSSPEELKWIHVAYC